MSSKVCVWTFASNRVVLRQLVFLFLTRISFDSRLLFMNNYYPSNAHNFMLLMLRYGTVEGSLNFVWYSGRCGNGVEKTLR